MLLTGVSLKTQCPEAKDLLIPIGPRFHLAPSTIWRPFIEFRPVGAPTFRMYGQDQILRQFVKMPMAQVCGTAPQTRKGDSFAVEMVLVRLAYVADLPTPAEVVEKLQSAPASADQGGIGAMPGPGTARGRSRAQAGGRGPLGMIRLSAWARGAATTVDTSRTYDGRTRSK